MASKTLGRYELLDRLAVGGMAEIYVARVRGFKGFHKEYVLKLIHPKHSGDDAFMQMLVDEAKLTAQLRHVNIAQVIDLGNHEKTCFIVMEYVRGKDLHQILNQAYDLEIPVPLEICAFVTKEVAAGLYYANTKTDDVTKQPLSLVHRDISPQNILVSWDGEVKIVDFGVAKAALAARPETQAGVIKGKFRYMSPEQAWGEKLDGRSDIFSLGLCLYEMATSSMAYDDEPDMRKMLIKMREASFESPSKRRPEIDADLERLISRCLSRRKEDRFKNAEDLEQAMGAYNAAHCPEFTRRSIRDFMAKLWPNESPHKQSTKNSSDTASLTVRPGDFAVQESEAGITHELDALDLEDTDDRTNRHIVQSLKSSDVTGDFEDEKTSLYAGSEVEPQGETAELGNAHMIAMLKKSRGNSPSELPAIDPMRNAQPGVVPLPSPPQEVASSWMPQEFNPAQNVKGAPATTAWDLFGQLLKNPQTRTVILPMIGVVALLFVVSLILVAIAF